MRHVAHFAFVLGLAVVHGLAQPASQRIQLNVQEQADGNGPADLVSNAIPFKQGVVSDERQVRLLDGGAEAPLATKILARWPDNSIRSLLLQFAVPSAPRTFSLEVGGRRASNDRAFQPVSWDIPRRIFTLPAAYLSESEIFGEQKPLGQSGYPAWDRKQMDGYRRIETVGNAPCVRDDHYYDAITTTYQLYARTGELRHLVNARRWALHHRRDQIWLDGANAGHPRCANNYLNNTRYTFPLGLAQDYFMFGDQEAIRVSALVVDRFYMAPSSDRWYYKAPNTRGFWTEREPAFALLGILAQYEATGEQRYLNHVRDRVRMLHRMQVENGRRAWIHNLYDHDPSEGCAQGDYGSSPWMTGLLLESIIQYHKLTNDSTARESILMAVDDLMASGLATGQNAGRSFRYLTCSEYRDGAPDLDNLISHAYAYAFRLTGNQTYKELGQALFNTAVTSGVTASHKHYNQQFRSSGHYVGYMGNAANPAPRGQAVNAASSAAGAIAPGEIISLYADAIGPNEAAVGQVREGRFSRELAGVTVSIGGLPSPLLYASRNQLNVVVPYGIAIDGEAEIVVSVGGQVTFRTTVPIAAAAPGVFAVLNQDFTLNSESNPATRGSVVIVYATGEGMSSPTPQDGQIVSDALPRPRLAVQASIGGQPAAVDYAGATPGSVAGLLQVNARVPENSGVGANSLVLNVAEFSSQAGFSLYVR